MNQAELILFAVRIWGTIGALVAAVFLTVGMDRIDEDARGAYVFRPLLIPGVLLIWPLVLWRWYQCETGGGAPEKRYMPPRKAHSVVGMGMLAVICLVIAVGLSLRQTWPVDIAPIQLSQPGEATE